MQLSPHAGSGDTWAKIILFGEHSVVYGHPALALPLRSLRMHAQVRPAAGVPMLRSLDYRGELAASGRRFACLRRAVDVALERVGQPHARLDIETVSDFPPERGMGSSAASAGAVIRAVLGAFGVSASPAELFELTQQAEQVAHGQPSGLDAAVTAAQGPVRFESGRMELVQMKLDAHLVVADSGIRGSTRVAVTGVRERYEREPGAVGELLADLGGLARQALRDVAEGNVHPLGEAMNHAQQLLTSLGVSHERLDVLNDAAIRAGALGAKLTGGGLGGCVISLAPTARIAQQVRSALTGAGAVATWIHPLQPVEVTA
ncbi:mevalonate kinase [Propionibacterium cyclohexanicum]|uniref:Mevalonate kinase n=1 Tax=Propionibacterium cyclohexanicum TaxID=64702 RepID=A0A1H9Q1C0_9ACTN|nr:mevalonate kinase [Propionibacterium cyclohexanicum]SER53673.1 mevalonate kinase [Propionibacterium cyclohexanicum]